MAPFRKPDADASQKPTMHELSLAENMRDIVDGTARANQARRVTLVRLEIGQLAQVEIEAMRFAFDVVMRGSLADGAQLEIVQTAGSAWCPGCARTVALAQRGDACPHCDGYALRVTGGDRMRVMEIELE